jgi:hypothetical protein
MNNSRRQALSNIRQAIESAQTSLSSIKMQEEMALDSLPENLRESSKAEAMENAIDHMDSACDHLEEASEDITNASS